MSALVRGVGMLTPVGLSAAASCAALRAGIARIKELETYEVDGEYFDKKKVIGGRVPTEWFDGGPQEWEWPGHERFGKPVPPAPEALVAPGAGRLIELAVPALREALEDAGLERPGGLALYLGLADEEEDVPLVQALQETTRGAFTEVHVEKRGRAAALVALARALEDLKSNGRTVVVGGVDSQIRSKSLARMESDGILRSDSHPIGVIPGEAAAFVVLDPQEGRLPVTAAFVAEEPTAGTDDPNRAEGLTEVFHGAREAMGGLTEPPVVVCDLNGTRYRAMEWASASIRAFGDLHGDEDLRHPADCIGDPGAASGVVNLIWASTGMLRGYMRRSHALIWGASESPARAACVLQAPGTN